MNQAEHYCRVIQRMCNNDGNLLATSWQDIIDTVQRNNDISSTISAAQSVASGLTGFCKCFALGHDDKLYIPPTSGNTMQRYDIRNGNVESVGNDQAKTYYGNIYANGKIYNLTTDDVLIYDIDSGTEQHVSISTGFTNPMWIKAVYDSNKQIFFVIRTTNTTKVFIFNIDTLALNYVTLPVSDYLSFIAIDGNGYIYINNYQRNTLCRIDSSNNSVESQHYSQLSPWSSNCMTPDGYGNLFYVSGSNNTGDNFIYNIETQEINKLNTRSQGFCAAIVPSGKIFIADYESNTVKVKIANSIVNNQSVTKSIAMLYATDGYIYLLGTNGTIYKWRDYSASLQDFKRVSILSPILNHT